MVSDDELSTVGSTNVDFRSFEHNFEVNAFIYDTETALQMREIFLQDQRECVQVFSKIGRNVLGIIKRQKAWYVCWLRFYNLEIGKGEIDTAIHSSFYK